MIYLRRIVGWSMEPTFRPDQLVLFYRTKNIAIGDVVLCAVNDREVIKRVTELDLDNNRVWIEGDNHRHSTDSRHYGWVEQQFIRGKLLLTFKKTL